MTVGAATNVLCLLLSVGVDDADRSRVITFEHVILSHTLCVDSICAVRHPNAYI